MPNVRPLNDKYGLSKHEFHMAYSFCMQYPEWKHTLKLLTSSVKSPTLTGMPTAHGGSDATSSLAAKRISLENKIKIVEETMREVTAPDPILYPYLLEYVTTEGCTYQMMSQKKIPCGRTYFYQLRRKFYCKISEQINKKI